MKLLAFTVQFLLNLATQYCLVCHRASSNPGKGGLTNKTKTDKIFFISKSV